MQPLKIIREGKNHATVDLGNYEEISIYGNGWRKVYNRLNTALELLEVAEKGTKAQLDAKVKSITK